MMHQCPDCEFETKCTRDFGRHRMYHEEKSTHQCPWCSYSVNFAIHLTRHVKQFHTKTDMKTLSNEKQVLIFEKVSLNHGLILIHFSSPIQLHRYLSRGQSSGIISPTESGRDTNYAVIATTKRRIM